jgi:hypothetical protein
LSLGRPLSCLLLFFIPLLASCTMKNQTG